MFACYDPEKDEWTILAPLPRQSADPVAVAFHLDKSTPGSAKILLAGGQEFVGINGYVHGVLSEYDFKTDTWYVCGQSNTHACSFRSRILGWCTTVWARQYRP